MSAEWPTPEAEQELVRKLLSRDPTATADLFVAFHSLLTKWLQFHNRHVDDQIHHDAASEALVALMKNPQSYRAEGVRSLTSYLKMSADRDMKNLLRKEHKHQSGRNSLESVELGPNGGKYFGRGEDPGRELELQDDARRIEATLIPLICEGMSPEELAGFDLYVGGEKSTDAFAAALHLDDVPVADRAAAVKKFKDKLKARIKRARGLHDEPS